MATEHDADALTPEALAEGRRLMTLTEKDGGGAYYDGDFRYDPADDLEEWFWTHRAALLAAAEREAKMREALEAEAKECGDCFMSLVREEGRYCAEHDALAPVAERLQGVLHSSICTKCGWHGTPTLMLGPTAKGQWACGNPACDYLVSGPKSATIERLNAEIAAAAEREAAMRKALDPTLLRNLMSDISEACYCAGWLMGLEFTLWHALEHGHQEFGVGLISRGELAALRAISEAVGGWWVWEEGAMDERFVTLDEWRATYHEQGWRHCPEACPARCNALAPVAEGKGGGR